MLHGTAFTAGYYLARCTVASKSLPLARCISLEAGMQVSLQELAQLPKPDMQGSMQLCH